MATPGDVTRQDLLARLEQGEHVVLVDALPPMSYALSRLPGAVNLTPESVDRWAPVRVPDKATPVVVYCAGPGCESSGIVARRLLELGYTNVGHYPGGKSDWAEAGLPLEGTSRARPR